MAIKIAIPVVLGLLTGLIIVVVFLGAGSSGPACVSGHYDYIPEAQYNPATKSVTTSLVPLWICDVYQSTTPKEK